MRGALLALGLAACAAAAPPDAAAPVGGTSPATAGASALPLSAYQGVGSDLAQSAHFADLGWNEAQLNAFLDGFRAAFQGKAYPMDAAARQLSAEMSRKFGEIAARARQQGVMTAEEKAQRDSYFKDLRKRFGLQTADSGLGYNVEPGRNGIRPRPGDTVVFTCEARGADGVTKLPQLSSERIRVRMDGMLPGLMEGLQMMTVGSHAVFVLPSALSFGEGPWPDGVPRGSPLIYSITLHDVISAGAQP